MNNHNCSMKPIKVAVIDFDGVLSLQDAYPVIKELNLELIAILREFQKLGGKVILCTARENEQLAFAIQALEEVGFVPDCINDNIASRVKQYRHNCRKITGDIIIDDCCIDFTGDTAKYRRILIDDNPYFKGANAGFRRCQ